MYTLLIVDMQGSFYAKETLQLTKNLEKEILCAINNKASIVFVEFSNSGPTLDCLAELPRGHGYSSYTIEKHQNDGSREIASLVVAHNLPVTHFKVTGINTDYCVAATVGGLSKLFPEAVIEVVDNCCASLWSKGSPNKSDHEDGIKVMKKLTNVVITNQTQLI